MASGRSEGDEEPARGGDGGGHRVDISFRLPRDRTSVTLVRHLVSFTMDEIGVVADIRDAVNVAVSEACANVITHSGPGDAYDVTISFSQRCEIRVIDSGHGFDAASLSSQMAGHEAERGRGVALMHALMDDVTFTSEPETGTIVHLVKELEFEPEAPARRLLGST
ncbi:MAG TPA: ATP-binding protein [Acidimicrobiales bacterium]|nr:ATP-binding protein [Acidimicrobiales bacterium]